MVLGEGGARSLSLRVLSVSVKVGHVQGAQLLPALVPVSLRVANVQTRLSVSTMHDPDAGDHPGV